MKASAPPRNRWAGSRVYSLALLSTGLIVSSAPAAAANQVGLTFELPPAVPRAAPPVPALDAAAPPDSTHPTASSPLKIPAEAISPLPWGKPTPASSCRHRLRTP